jgi:galactokinase
MTGGGFGGAAIALLEDERMEPVTKAVVDAFSTRGFAVPRLFPVLPADGARRLP